MSKDNNRSEEFDRGGGRSDGKSVKGVLKFWLVFIGVLIGALLVCMFAFGWWQGR
jgi:hypothetical protein